MSDVKFFARVAVATLLDLVLMPLLAVAERIDEKYASALGGDDDE